MPGPSAAVSGRTRTLSTRTSRGALGISPRCTRRGGQALGAGPWRRLLAVVVAGCAAPTGALQERGAEPVRVDPQRDWSDAVLYFVLLDRFADGDPGNDVGVDRKNPGGFHGGDLRGLTAELDEIASLGATALWITPIVRQIDSARRRRAAPSPGSQQLRALRLPRLLGRRLQPPRSALRHRGGARRAGRGGARARHEGPARRRLQPRRLRFPLPGRSRDARLVSQQAGRLRGRRR